MGRTKRIYFFWCTLCTQKKHTQQTHTHLLFTSKTIISTQSNQQWISISSTKDDPYIYHYILQVLFCDLWVVLHGVEALCCLLQCRCTGYSAFYYQNNDGWQRSSNNCTTSTALIIQCRDKYLHEYTAIIKNSKWGNVMWNCWDLAEWYSRCEDSVSMNKWRTCKEAQQCVALNAYSFR